MYVYSLIARTKSEMRDVPLSISFSRVATSTEAAILTRAARAVSASRVANNDSSASGLTFLRASSAAICHKSFWPWLRNKESICSSRSLTASGSERYLVALDECSFQFFDFSFLRRRQITTAQFVARIAYFLQHVAQLARGTFRSRRWIIEFMGEPC